MKTFIFFVIKILFFVSLPQEKARKRSKKSKVLFTEKPSVFSISSGAMINMFFILPFIRLSASHSSRKILHRFCKHFGFLARTKNKKSFICNNSKKKTFLSFAEIICGNIFCDIVCRHGDHGDRFNRCWLLYGFWNGTIWTWCKWHFSICFFRGMEYHWKS